MRESFSDSRRRSGPRQIVLVVVHQRLRRLWRTPAGPVTYDDLGLYRSDHGSPPVSIRGSRHEQSLDAHPPSAAEAAGYASLDSAKVAET